VAEEKAPPVPFDTVVPVAAFSTLVLLSQP